MPSARAATSPSPSSAADDRPGSGRRLIDGVSQLLAFPAPDERRRRAAELCRQIGPAVYRRCLRMLGDEKVAGEAAQAVLIELVRDARVLRATDAVTALRRAYDAATAHCLDLLAARERVAAFEGA